MGQGLSCNISLPPEEIAALVAESPPDDLSDFKLTTNPETGAASRSVHQAYLNPQNGVSSSVPLSASRPSSEAENMDPVSQRLVSAGIPIPRRGSAYFNPVAITPREIWLMVGEEIDTNRKRTLLNLTLTCRLFRDIFTPFLFEHINLTSFNTVVSDRFDDFMRLDQLCHVRSLTVASAVVYNRMNVDPRVELYNITLFNERIMECLLRMPGLVSFSFGELGREKLLEPYTAAGFCSAPLFSKTLDILRENNPRLRHLAIKMPYIPPPTLWAQRTDVTRFWDAYQREAAQHLGHFKNLRSLSVAYFSSNMQATAPSLLETLLASPDLVALSIDGPSNMRAQQWATGQDFLHSICTEYAEKKGKPLALKRFHVGENLTVPDGLHIRSYFQRWSDLENLIKFSDITDLHVHNQSQDMAHSSAPAGWSQQPLYQIITDKKRFHSLVCLSVERLDMDMAKLIHSVGKDLSLPMSFLSKLHFYWFDYNNKKLRDKLRFDSFKQTFWPKMVSFTRPSKVRNVTTSRKRFVDAIVEWRGLEALRIPLDLCRRADGDIAESIAVRMPNLKHFAIHQMIWAAPPSRSSERVNANPLFLIGFAYSLCAQSNLTYVRIHDQAYRVVRHEQNPTCYSLDEIDLRTSAAYESELFTLYRE